MFQFALAIELVTAALLAAPPPPLAIAHVTVISMTTREPLRNQTVIIKGGVITDLGDSAVVRIPDHARVMDASRQYLIPGLWDMHVHVEDEDQFFPLCLANGVTGARDMGGTWKQFAQIQADQRAIERGARLGPRLVVSSPMLDGGKATFEGSVNVTSPAQARSVMGELKQRGAELIKVMDLVSPQVFSAIMDEARTGRLPVVVHVPLAVGAAETARQGVRSMEHLIGVMLACSTEEQPIRRALVDTVAGSGYDFATMVRQVFFAPPPRIRETWSEAKARELFQIFKDRGTWQTPTLVLWRNEAFIGERNSLKDARLRYVPQRRKQDWNREYYILKPLRDADFEQAQRNYAEYLRITRAMRDGGVGLLAGTDAYNPLVIPGFSLHEELELMVQAGLTPIEALETATRNAAASLGRTDLGAIGVGKLADLVLLDADPLADIRNTQKIRAVIARGRLFERGELDRMLHDVQVRARQARPAPQGLSRDPRERSCSARKEISAGGILPVEVRECIYPQNLWPWPSSAASPVA